MIKQTISLSILAAVVSTSAIASFKINNNGSVKFLKTKSGEELYSYKVNANAKEVVAKVKPNLHLKYDQYFTGHKFNKNIDVLKSNGEEKLFIVKYKTQIFESFNKELSNLNIKAVKYVPDHAQLVRATEKSISKLEQMAHVAYTTEFKPVYKLEELILENMATKSAKFFNSQNLYSIVATNLEAKENLMNAIQNLGGSVEAKEGKGLAFVAKLNGRELSHIAGSADLTWAEEYNGPELDMDNVLIQGGSRAIQRSFENGLTGVGIKGHILEGVYATHPDLAANEHRQAPIGIWDDSSASHGMQTFGIVFSSGEGRADTRGLLPNGQGYYTHYNAVYNKDGRYDLTEELINDHNVMFQTASWGYSRTREYGARSAEMDHIIFNLDIPVTQSQSNAGNQDSRPQAWAKNIISVGAVKHKNTADPSDDSWSRGASIGPAKDGRIKPEICAYYDDIDTVAGSSRGYGSFGGTSGATPIVAGHVGLIIEMWTKGYLNNESELTGTTLFENRAHAMTTKALLINSARQYPFSGRNHDLTRVHQGWGFPSLADLNKAKNDMLVVNESEVLKVADSREYTMDIAAGRKELKATMIFREPEALVSSAKQAINDLNLIVTSPSGKVYYGNNGLLEGNYSKAGGEADSINTVENVFIENPEVGTWTIKVEAKEINTDGHLATANEVDSAFSLVVRNM